MNCEGEDMKVIEMGSLPEERNYRATCRHCGTVFEFLRAEAKYVIDQRDGDFLSIQCPLPGCAREVTVSA